MSDKKEGHLAWKKLAAVIFKSLQTWPNKEHISSVQFSNSISVYAQSLTVSDCTVSSLFGAKIQ